MKIAEYHSPVLFEESLRALLWNPNGVYADCTLGGGGHSEGILKRLEPAGHLHSFDRDPEAIAYARKRHFSSGSLWPTGRRGLRKLSFGSSLRFGNQ